MSSELASMSVISKCLKKPGVPLQTLIPYAWIYTAVPSKQEYQHYWTIRYDHGLQSSGRWKMACILCVIQRRRTEICSGGKKKGGDVRDLLEKEENTNKEKREKRENWRRCVDSLLKCYSSSSSSITPLHHPCNHFQHIKFGLTTIAELQ